MTTEEYTRIGSEELLKKLSDQLSSQGRRPYSIPVGGSNALGCWGYLEAVREIEGQVADLGITDIALVAYLLLTPLFSLCRHKGLLMTISTRRWQLYVLTTAWHSLLSLLLCVYA